MGCVEAIAFGMWGCDRFLGCGGAISFWGVEGAIAVGDVGAITSVLILCILGGDCPENYWCYRSLHRKHLFQALSHKNMATHFVHEVLWDKGFRINTLGNHYLSLF